MANVRFTQTLRDEIITNAQNQMAPLYNNARIDPITWGHGNWGNELYSLVMGPLVPNILKLPAAWPVTTHAVVLRYMVFEDLGRVNMDLRLPVTTTNPILVPLPFGTLNSPTFHAGPRHDNALLVDLLTPCFETADLYTCAHEALQRRTEASKRVRDYVSGVRALIDKHATLRPALKEWPPLWDLLSEAAKAKAREIDTPRPRKAAPADAPEPQIDLDTMTALAVGIKIGGGM